MKSPESPECGRAPVWDCLDCAKTGIPGWNLSRAGVENVYSVEKMRESRYVTRPRNAKLVATDCY